MKVIPVAVQNKNNGLLHWTRFWLRQQSSGNCITAKGVNILNLCLKTQIFASRLKILEVKSVMAGILGMVWVAYLWVYVYIYIYYIYRYIRVCVCLPVRGWFVI